MDTIFKQLSGFNKEDIYISKKIIQNSKHYLISTSLYFVIFLIRLGHLNSYLNHQTPFIMSLYELFLSIKV